MVDGRGLHRRQSALSDAAAPPEDRKTHPGGDLSDARSSVASSERFTATVMATHIIQNAWMRSRSDSAKPTKTTATRKPTAKAENAEGRCAKSRPASRSAARR